ncbi:bifunctional phosphoglucose/phosphomannose isomerase [candidate division KSB1 bacterium]|nr:bifunctional phosphoglucose/phosphomannose isomerase [candidate division KSB1 bacterium]
MNANINISIVDRHNMFKLLTSFPDQFQHARQIGNDFKFNVDPSKIKTIVFAGMGGSAIGGDLVISYLGNQINKPASVIRNYSLPGYVDSSSLVIISSYSGNTEESISCLEQAKAKNAQILCITSGGQVAEQARANRFPVITIPGGAPPRTALAYLSVPLMIFLTKNGFASDISKELDETELLLRQKTVIYLPDSNNNPAFDLAEKLSGKIPILYSTADLLGVVGLRWKGQLSENAKVLAFQNVFPELNHNEIVGWETLRHQFENFQIIYLRDRADHPRNQKRMEITKKILEQVAPPILEIFAEGESRLARLFSLIYLGDMASFYLAILNGIDPTPIEKIQLLKDQLQIMN